MKSNRQLTKREKLFCCFYASTGNVKEAAIMAGVSTNAEQWGYQLLLRDNIQKEIDLCLEKHKKDLQRKALTGYERLAFGSISDGVRLLYLQNPTKEILDNMDLYSVSEIKRPKDGAMEIKFFDRQKALDKLFESSDSESKNVLPFYRALEEGASALNNSIEEYNDGI